MKDRGQMFLTLRAVLIHHQSALAPQERGGRREGVITPITTYTLNIQHSTVLCTYPHIESIALLLT